MDFMKALGSGLQGMGGAVQRNAQGPQQAAPQQSPTSAFVEAARQANLERQQAAQVQMQTAPTATAGGAMTQIQPAAPVGGGAPLPTMQSHGALSAPPGGMVTQGQADPAILAMMARGRF